MMANRHLLSSVVLCLFAFCSLVDAQQNYSANSVLRCNSSDASGPSPAILYTCNGQEPSCVAFLIFKSQPPYDSVAAISVLTSSVPAELARANNVSKFTSFSTGKEVIVPVNCSCSGQYYQANTTYQLLPSDHTYFLAANNTYQGLSTCDALERANPYGVFDLHPGMELQVPLRCACPTKNQAVQGTRYLLTYSVTWGDKLPELSSRFNASEESVRFANGFSKEGDATLFPFTTILIPLASEPLSSQTVIRNGTATASEPDVMQNSEKKKPKRSLYAGIAVVIGCLLVILALILCVFYLMCNKKTKKEATCGNFQVKQVKETFPSDLLIEIASFEKALKLYDFEELKKATENFSSKNCVKSSVYRGVFGDQTFAIKRMGTDVSKEVNMMNKVNHFNLISLHGFCEDQGFFYLVFEYMENGSLKEWLSNEGSKDYGSWLRRLQIALDVANGLYYLHNFIEPALVHKDIKSSNILLNGDLRAKIANFSLAKTAETNGAGALTAHVKGTRGYMAPEYLESGLITPKIDVFAFGVVMLELFTGQDVIILRDGKEVLLSAEIVAIMEEANAEAQLGHFIDDKISGNNGLQYVVRIIRLAVACLTSDPASRPSMDDVVSSLLKIQADVHKSQLPC